MSHPEQHWSAEHGRRFHEHYKTMRGYVRREVTRRDIESTLGDYLSGPRRIIDLGGGEGDDARWLAAKGHEVVLADPDSDAIAHAMSSGAELEVIVLGTADNVIEEFGPGSFDMALSHGTLLYSDNPAHELNQTGLLLKPGGYLSLLTAGKFGKMRRFERSGQSAALAKLLATGRYVNNLGLEATAYLPQEVDDLLTANGFKTEAWFGVRIFSDEDDRPVDEVPVLHKNRILRHEILASADPTIRPAGQLLHFLARKNT